METLTVLMQQMKEQEERDAAYAKKIRDCETVIKTEEENIKHLQGLESKLTEELERKMWELSEKETTHEILHHQSLIWTDLRERTHRELTEAEAKLDALQQSICLDRIAFCDNIKDYIDKHDFVKISRGFARNQLMPITSAKRIKTEPDDDEYNSLLEEVSNLESILEDLKAEEAQIEEAKQLKAQLQAEPSSGEHFVRLQNSLKDKKNELKDLEGKIKTVKSEIAQKDLLLLKRKKWEERDLLPSEHQGFQPNSQNEMTRASTSQNTGTNATTLKVVKFNDSVETKQILPSSPTNSILKSRMFTAKSPSPSLRKKLSQQLFCKLDGKMKNILFKKD